MDISLILFSFGTVGGLGILFGVLLAFASRILAVDKDERITRVEEALPGVNCGACGYAGCSAYAEAIIMAEADLTLCAPGGAETAEAIAAVMGREVTTSRDRLVAKVLCRGGRQKATYHYEYAGVRDCNALSLLFGGDKDCPYGCLGLGSCVRVCPVDAIAYTADGLVEVNRQLCIGCGKCVNVCPTGVMQMIPDNADVVVACRSTDKGPLVKKYCAAGCIGCKICEKQSPAGGFKVENFLATIDYTQQGERENALAKCPSGCIIRHK